MVLVIEDVSAPTPMVHDIPIIDTMLKTSITFNKPTTVIARHLKPLYLKAHFNGIHMLKVLMDNGASVNLLLSRMMKHLQKIEKNLVEANVSIIGFLGASVPLKAVLPIIVAIGSKTLKSHFCGQYFSPL